MITRKWALSLVVILPLILFPLKSHAVDYVYHMMLQDGGSFIAATYHDEGEDIRIFLVEPEDASITIPKSSIARIVKQKTEEKPSADQNNRKIGSCDYIPCDSGSIDCCKRLRQKQERMTQTCDQAENPKNTSMSGKKTYVDQCQNLRDVVPRLENQCPTCNMMKRCCGIAFF